jgi:hypothetical protein
LYLKEINETSARNNVAIILSKISYEFETELVFTPKFARLKPIKSAKNELTARANM